MGALPYLLKEALLDKAVEIENLSFNYPDGRQALVDINLTVVKSQIVAIIGPNGAGKSTLLLHLNGILRSNGTVRILGIPVNDKNLKWIRSKVGLVFQDPDDQLFSPTVFDDVAFGPVNVGCSEEDVRERVTRALAAVGMSGYEQRAPHHLSFGQKKRVAIATVLSMEPELLVIDEPSANLDPRAKWDLIALLQELPVTKIVASHDLELVQALCQRAVVLDEGRIVADDFTSRILFDVSLLEAHGLAPSNRAVYLKEG